MPARQRPSEDGGDWQMCGSEGQHRSEVFGEADCECGDGATLAYGEDHPAVEERREFAVGLAQEDILPAGFRKHRAHLGEGEARQQRDRVRQRAKRQGRTSGLCTAEAIGAAVRKIPEPMMPPANSITESVSERPRTSDGA